MKKLFFSFFFLLPLLFSSAQFVHASYPDYKSYVNDIDQVFSEEERLRIEQKLSDLDTKTSIQIAVLTIDSTEPESLEDYTIHLADRWKVGQVHLDNGVIMVFAMKDKKMRLEVGRGLEGILTDIQAKHILNDIIRPEFQRGKYSAGIEKGVDAIIATVVPNSSVTPVPRGSTSDAETLVIIFIVVSLVIFILAVSPHTPLGGAGVWGLPMFWGRVGGNDSDSTGFGGFGGGSFSGGGSSSSW